ncbi:MAG: FKBP-type peptidyl-prolyl cis-trans isomerase [Bacteroidales bacterium]|nr:FKBP-type peptidyl-prolyl cis-trans isomerase [Bacteroidales bacterium]
MNTRLIRFLIFATVVMLFSSCEADRKKPKTLSEVRSYEKPLEKVNKYLANKDEKSIANHCKRRGWNMNMTDSGLWYGKLKSTEQDSIKKGQIVELKYKVELMDGTILYDSDSVGTKIFEVGHGGVESGLEEGILMMRTGEKYRFIMPPHRAHGLLGDLKKIPARTTIVYYVEIINSSS